MNYKNFTDLPDDIRRYNSTSILEVGSKICWKLWEDGYSTSQDWQEGNVTRNYVIRLMLLASGGNPHRQKNINDKEFNDFINVYRNLTQRTISDQNILDQEAQSILDSIKNWEIDDKNQNKVNTFVLKLSNILNFKLIREHTLFLFLQRIVAFQNAGFGYPLARINRTIKLIDLLDKHFNKDFNDNFSNIFSNYTQLSPINYFRQYQVCLGLFEPKKGFLNFNQMPTIDSEVLNLGITPENLKIFVEQNSLPFISKPDQTNSFRCKVTQTIKSVSDFYQPFFYNQFLASPLIKLDHENFCLPDPISLTESCWNQVRNIIYKDKEEKKAGNLLRCLFENYIQNILLPVISPESNSFCKIKEENDRKRADFLIKTSSAYILLECKNSVMSADTSSYFQADKLGNLWSRIHIGVEQISATAKDLNLKDKPVIPVVITFYDSIAASSVFQEMIKKTDYCSIMGLDMPPIVLSLHEFEHWLSDRSLNNWVELILAQQKGSSVSADNKGHNYKHLDNETQRWMITT